MPKEKKRKGEEWMSLGSVDGVVVEVKLTDGTVRLGDDDYDWIYVTGERLSSLVALLQSASLTARRAILDSKREQVEKLQLQIAELEKEMSEQEGK